MATRNATSTVLIVCLLLFTFPVWIGIAGGLVGIVAGIFGATIGIIGGIFGVVIGMMVLPFKILFGWGHGGWFPHFHGFFFMALVVVVVALLLRRKT
jgi:hypothetical protein